ncbi:MAG: cell division protein FtsQ [Sphingobacteriales bacterium 17-39-43]|uniref:cell division protein FtsQ/DivIB n=1 Tax=Daejeonella sp. TaxID=2805397 RepID=UPI000BCEFD63|nr:cell division protein FtsQ [Daejeonella sp.]OYZ29082.1 MAG: cell division protein FtsQ [Sphingobacteriales bacterium 16-39-50]OZA23093.1 MAG: cell division protein FtsQ [Sphingobacteriales bacterium 17-39-43]OZA62265.1 MAG: cell division protein FtsQ [Sphingobacteriales bacterium 39-40-5]HQS50331.1 cell division protein FtsQ [Daejeonella sp.]HQT24668.1 cell division protein FtsQ [Daejeonella sp.]
MLKKINWRAILFGFLWLISLSGLITLMSFIEIKKSALKCKDVKVLLPGQFNFIERDEVDRILMENGGAMLGKDLNDINIHKLENALKANPFIEFAKVYADMTGVIHVQIRQREPVLRVVNMANLHFYIDGNGNKIPLSDNYTAKVLVASGLIEEDFSGRVDTLKTKMARDLFRTALFIRSDTLWDNQIEQLFVDLKGDIEMVPRVGGHKIILGSADSLQIKFRNLLVFYKKAIPKVGWDTYKTINLKYANQIVCEKNIIDSTKITIDINKQIADSTITETQN